MIIGLVKFFFIEIGLECIWILKNEIDKEIFEKLVGREIELIFFFFIILGNRFFNFVVENEKCFIERYIK